MKKYFIHIKRIISLDDSEDPFKKGLSKDAEVIDEEILSINVVKEELGD